MLPMQLVVPLLVIVLTTTDVSRVVASFSPPPFGYQTSTTRRRLEYPRRQKTTFVRELASSTPDDHAEEEVESDGLHHQVHWLLDPYSDEDIATEPLGDVIGQGKAVISIPNVATHEECQYLFSAGLAACAERNTRAARGRNRFSVSDPNAFPNDVVLTCDEILLRVLDYIDEYIPTIYTNLFEPNEAWLGRQPLNAQLEQPTVPPAEYVADMCTSLRELYMMGELEWSEGEPAINVYETDGYFGAHKDHLALTVLIPLTSPTVDFAGGGTGFWAGNRDVDENPQMEPTTIIRPEVGTALVFGGDVTHAGMPVEGGYRSVFVCSFSTRTPASLPERLHGMQAPPQVSPNFKGTM